MSGPVGMQVPAEDVVPMPTTSDEAAMCEVFKRFDTNNNGVITRTELATVLKSLDPGRWDEASVNAIVEAADVNKDGHIAYSEFVAWLSSGERVGKDRMARNFIKGALEEPEHFKTMLGNQLLQHIRITCPEFSGKAGAIASSLLDSMQPSELQCLLEQPPAIRDQVLRPAILQAAAKIDAQRRANKEKREKAEGKNRVSTNVVWCAKTGLQSELQQLIMSRADVNVRGELKVDNATSSNVTALQFAAACGHSEVVKMLLAAGANSTDRVVTVMANAGGNEPRPAVATFSEGGSLYTEGDTAYDLARKNGHTEAARVLATWQDLIVQFPFNESVRQLYERSSPTNSASPSPSGSVAMSCLSPPGKSFDGPLSISKLRFGGDHYLSRALRLLQCTGPADVGDDTEVKLQAMQVEIDRLMVLVRNHAKVNNSFASQHSVGAGLQLPRKNLPPDSGGQEWDDFRDYAVGQLKSILDERGRRAPMVILGGSFRDAKEGYASDEQIVSAVVGAVPHMHMPAPQQGGFDCVLNGGFPMQEAVSGAVASRMHVYNLKTDVYEPYLQKNLAKFGLSMEEAMVSAQRKVGPKLFEEYGRVYWLLGSGRGAMGEATAARKAGKIVHTRAELVKISGINLRLDPQSELDCGLTLSPSSSAAA